MVSSKATDHDRCQMDDDEDGEEGLGPPPSGVACSICLDLVSDNGGRSRAKLQCGHEFHLDCIGSAFNIKGAMQCPNCRRIEKGQWLYANDSTCSLPELNTEYWIPNEDFYDLSYSETPFRVPWCPFGEFARLGSSFEEVEPPSTTYHDLRGHSALFTEHTGASSMVHSYVAYVGPVPPTTSRSSNNVDDHHLNHHRNGLSRQNEILTPQAFPAFNIQYHSWGLHSPPFSISSGHMNGAEPTSIPRAILRFSRGESDATPIHRSFHHPFVFDHGFGPRVGSSFLSSVVPRHPGSSSLIHERVLVSPASHHHQPSSNSPGLPTLVFPGIRRFDGSRSLPAVVAAAPLQHDQNGGFYAFPSRSSGQNIPETENPTSNHFNLWERERSSHFRSVSADSNWGSFHQNTRSSDVGNRSGSFWHRPSS